MGHIHVPILPTLPARNLTAPAILEIINSIFNYVNGCGADWNKQILTNIAFSIVVHSQQAWVNIAECCMSRLDTKITLSCFFAAQNATLTGITFYVNIMHTVSTYNYMQ